MGDGSVLSIRVAGEQSGGLVTVIEGVVGRGGPPLHVHQAEDEVVIVLDGELSYRVGDERGFGEHLMQRPDSAIGSALTVACKSRRSGSTHDLRHPR